MSVTMSKNGGVTVFTIQADPESRWPPVCQILKSLCYSPLCCSVSQHLKKNRRTSQSVLAAMQIMIGLLNIGFGAILRSSRDTDWMMNRIEFPYWLGALFIAIGAMCVLTEIFPSLCLVTLNVMANLAGVGLAIAAIVLYSIYVSHLDLTRDCRFSRSYGRYYYNAHTTTTQSPESESDREIFRQLCFEGHLVSKVILIGLNVLLILLAILELCAVLSSVVIGIKILKNSRKDEKKISEESEHIQPLLGDTVVPPTV